MSTMHLIEKEVTSLPEPQQRDHFDGLLASESVLAREWETPEEDAAWASL